MISKEVLNSHLTYSAWATDRLLHAVSEIPAAELTHDFKTGAQTIVTTLAHIYAADRIWFERVNGRRRATFIDERDRQLSVVRSEWPALLSDWRKWLAGYPQDRLDVPIDYTNLQGNPFKNSAAEIILHIVNHATHHRGQVSGFLRSLGHTPPALDLIVFYREGSR